MAKYIKADALRKWIQAECNPYGNPTLDYDTSVKVMNYIDNMDGIKYPPSRPTYNGPREIWIEYEEGWDDGWRACLDAIYDGGGEYA